MNMVQKNFDPPVKKDAALVEIESARAIQEVQALIVAAKKFPRDVEAAAQRMLKACERRGLAEVGLYTYQRGGSAVEGASIRLAEMMAQQFGNLDFGVKELIQRNGESEMMAYCWDLETNVRQTKMFTVKHGRYSKKNGMSPLEDPRDIYENNANYAARRLRACILGIIPGDIVEACENQCRQTLQGGGDVASQVDGMVKAFSEIGVTVPMLEKFLKHPLKDTLRQEIVTLRGVYTSIKDGMARKEAFFGGEEKKEGDLNQTLFEDFEE